MFQKTLLTPLTDLNTLVILSDPFEFSVAWAESEWNISLDPNHMPLGPRGRIIPGAAQMSALISSYGELVDASQMGRIVELTTDRTQWLTNAVLDSVYQIKYTVTVNEPALGCRNIHWLGEMIDSNHTAICSYRRCQRWYTR